MKTIILLGELGARFGRRHRFDVRTGVEAIRALAANFPDFASTLADSHHRGVGYRVLDQREPLHSVAQLAHPLSRRLVLVPVVSGAGGGVGQVLLGGAIIGAAFFTGGASLVSGSLVTSAAGQIAVGIGASLALGGIVQMLSPAPKAPGPAERPENKPSYVFDGPVNTTAQGQPVPVGYGRMIIGSAVISASIYAEELPIAGPNPSAVLAALGKS